MMWKLMQTNPNIPNAVQCVICQTKNGFEVRSVNDPEYLKWVAAGNTPQPADKAPA